MNRTKVMNTILIKKIKNALKTDNPILVINDIIAEYEEIMRLIRWRDKIISEGNYFDGYIKAVEDANEKIMKSGYFEESYEERFDREIKDYLKNL
jgi:hypothetical protein